MGELENGKFARASELKLFYYSFKPLELLAGCDDDVMRRKAGFEDKARCSLALELKDEDEDRFGSFDLMGPAGSCYCGSDRDFLNK